MRALRLLLALAFAVPSWAGQTSAPAPAKPVQLALDFSAKPALGPLLAPVAAVPAIPQMPQDVFQALRGGEAHAFYTAAVAHEWDIPRGDDRQEALFAEGADRAAADAAFAKLSEPAVILGKAAPKRRSTRIDYDEFGRQVAGARGLSANVFRDTDAKRRILLASGYTHLKGPNGARIPIGKADDVRVGRAFENVLKAYENR